MPHQLDGSSKRFLPARFPVRIGGEALKHGVPVFNFPVTPGT